MHQGRPAASSGLRALGVLCSTRLRGARLPAPELGAACSAPKVGALRGSCRGAHASCPLPAAPGEERGAAPDGAEPALPYPRRDPGPGSSSRSAQQVCWPRRAATRAAVHAARAGLRGARERAGSWDSEEGSRGGQRALLPGWISVTQRSWGCSSSSGPRETRDGLALQLCTRGLTEALNPPMPPLECLNVKPPSGNLHSPCSSSPAAPSFSSGTLRATRASGDP